MISLRKLATLKRETRLRKIASLLQEYEINLHLRRPVDLGFLAGLAEMLLSDETIPERIKQKVRTVSPGFSGGELLRICNAVRHDLLVFLGIESADWDFLVPETGELDSRRRVVYPIEVYLDDIRSPFNVGSIFRSAEAFGVSKILLSESTPLPTHPRARRAAMGCTDVVPWEIVSPERLAEEPALFALETGGTPLQDFRFPQRGLLVVGSEELGVGPSLLTQADGRLGRVSIPLLGTKRSLNVAAAFSILMYSWVTAISKGR